MAARHQQRVAEFDSCLNSEVVDLEFLREQSYRGIPEGGGRRATSWRILLGYLPVKRKVWREVCQAKRDLYKQLVEEMIVSTPEANSPVMEDHPLNPNPASNWLSFFKDNDVLLQIDKDVRRLCPDLTFFQQATTFPNLLVVGDPRLGVPPQEKLHARVTQAQLQAQTVERKGVGPSTLAASKKRAVEDYAPLNEGQEAHWEVVERMLFLYAKLNPGQGYVQGMNEIIGPIYYVLAADNRIEWKEHAEADCFFCFTNLMSDIRDFFIKTLDDSATGIQAMMVRLNNRLSEVDQAVAIQLQEQGIKMQYFAFRWLTLLLSQEFALPDVLRLWDALLTDDTRSNLLINVCTSMLFLVRDNLLNNDFASNMKMLQNYPLMDMSLILGKAKELSNNS
eukprot:TRINITY_DN17098_c0_g1_i1.p1 TRINITY_DN17098_c0_g1~~TRINITY_DN17098_c0_g1_i1.p1  ORF type:complete len:393 (-),score=158.68 TRINITY_DN17098_c0_g1_i1:174-1352(-)